MPRRQPIEITAIEYHIHRVEARRSETSRPGIYTQTVQLWLDGSFLGFAPPEQVDEWLRRGCNRIIGMEVALSDGRKLLVAERQLEYRRAPLGETRAKFATSLKFGRGFPRLTYRQLRDNNLQPGLTCMANWPDENKVIRPRQAKSQLSTVDQPFWLDLRHRCLTNGRVRIPLKRPHGAEWRQYAVIDCLQGISSANWALMLKTVIGKKLDYVINLAAVRQQMTVMRTERLRQEQTRKRVEARLHGRCLLVRSAKSIALGKWCISPVVASGEHRFWVVDSPEPATAMYVFDSQEDAYAWASQAVDWRTAASKAVVRIAHHDGWEVRHGASLANLGLAQVA